MHVQKPEDPLITNQLSNSCSSTIPKMGRFEPNQLVQMEDAFLRIIQLLSTSKFRSHFRDHIRHFPKFY